jgi:acetyltransferase
MHIVEQMKLFMEPRSIALIGVSRSAGDSTLSPLRNLLDYGFCEKVYPVNPGADEILGIKAYPSLQHIPDEVDLAVILTPRATVPDIVKECTQKGIKALIVVAQGFADSDNEGKALQDNMVKIARQGGARIIGPNTFGVANAFTNMCTGLPRFKLGKTPVGVICQTGLMFCGASKFRFGKIVDLGNACDVDAADALEYFEDDPDIEVVVLHVESIRNGKRFIEVATRVAKKKLILTVKAGRSEYGAKAAQSHSGSIVGRDEVYEAAFRQCGVIRVNDLEEMEDVALASLRMPPMRGKQVAIMTWAGSTGVFAVDACEKYGLKMAELSPATLNKLRCLSPPPWLPIGNPVDIWAIIGLLGFDPGTFKTKFKTILEALLDEKDADAVVVIIPDFLELFSSEDFDISPLVLEAANTFKPCPIAFSVVGPEGELVSRLEQVGKVPVFPTPERAVRVIARLRGYAEFRETRG